MCSEIHAQSDLQNRTYLQEDYNYIPVWTLSEYTPLRQIISLGGGGPERWVYTKNQDDAKWEIDQPRQGFQVRSTWHSPKLETRRADTKDNPRLPPLQGENVEAIGSVRLIKGPLIRGLHNVVIPMPVDWHPLFGMQKEIIRLIPGLVGAVQRDSPESKI